MSIQSREDRISRKKRMRKLRANRICQVAAVLFGLVLAVVVIVLLRVLVFRKRRRYRSGVGMGAGRRGHYSGRRRR